MRALSWLDEKASYERLSSELRALLKDWLGASGQTARAFSAYRAGSFPALKGTSSERVLDVLVWRSGVVDFLSDIWDTIGAAPFEMEECQFAINALFTPASLSGIVVCPNCLQPLPIEQDAASAHYFDCPIRLRRDAERS